MSIPSGLAFGGLATAGGHVLVLPASDPRFKCVVAQVPTISGIEQGHRRVTDPEAKTKLLHSLTDSDRAQYRGRGPTCTPLFGTEPPGLYHDYPPDYSENSLTTRSARAARLYEPGRLITDISHTPLLFVVAEDDTATDLALEAYAQASAPKRHVQVPCRHFEIDDPPYFQQSGPAGCGWFHTHATKHH